MSKVDFVVMLMTALDHEVDLNRSDAVFADLDKLSAGRRAYLAEAADAGIVPADGTLFEPLNTVTLADAALYIRNALDIDSAEPGRSALRRRSRRTDQARRRTHPAKGAALYRNPLNVPIIGKADGQMSVCLLFAGRVFPIGALFEKGHLRARLHNFFG